MRWPVGVLDHHGVLHGARLGDRAGETVCAQELGRGAPYGCEITDPLAGIYFDGDVPPAQAKDCPICYPRSADAQEAVGDADQDELRKDRHQDAGPGDEAGDGQQRE